MTDPDPTEPESDAPHVIAALRRVIRDLPAIGKDQEASAQQGGYKYRGIEAITQHVQPLFARHGVVFVPHVVSWEIRDITVGGKPWTDTVETIEYDVFGPGGPEDKIVVGPILAVGRDNSDKGANKCMTQAYKYALLQVLTISDAKDDGDGSTNEAEHRDPPLVWTATMVKQSLVNALGSTEEAADAWSWGEGGTWTTFSADQANDLLDRWEAHKAATAGGATEPAEGQEGAQEAAIPADLSYSPKALKEAEAMVEEMTMDDVTVTLGGWDPPAPVTGNEARDRAHLAVLFATRATA